MSQLYLYGPTLPRSIFSFSHREKIKSRKTWKKLVSLRQRQKNLVFKAYQIPCQTFDLLHQTQGRRLSEGWQLREMEHLGLHGAESDLRVYHYFHLLSTKVDFERNHNDYKLYNSKGMIFWKRYNYGDSKMITDFWGLVGKV